MSHPLDAAFSALADPTRRAILTMLLEDDMAVTDVAEPFDMSLAAISKHLGILSRAGLITQEQRGRVKWCKLEPDALRDASIWMQSFGQFEAVNLDAFEREFTTNEDTEFAGKFNISRDSLIGNTPVTWKAGVKLRDREKVRDVNILVYEDDSLNLADFARDTLIPDWRLGNEQPTWPDPDLTRALRNAFTDADLDEEASFFDSTGEDY